MLKGVFPVVPTMFADDNSLDLAAQRKVVRFAVDAGAHGVVFPGVASEYDHLTSEERGSLFSVLVEEADGQVPIVGGASAPSVAGAIDAARQAHDVGVRFLMIMAPAQLESNLAAHHKFFTAIAAALPDIQIVLQNAPPPIGAGLCAETIAKLVSSIPAIRFVKEECLPSGPAITAVLSAGIPHLDGVFGGGGARYIIDELLRGASGAMPAVELIDLHVALYEAYTAGDVSRARRLYQISLPLLTTQTLYRMRLTKHVLSRRGITDCLNVRAPLPELDDISRTNVDEMLAELLAEFP